MFKYIKNKQISIICFIVTDTSANPGQAVSGRQLTTVTLLPLQIKDDGMVVCWLALPPHSKKVLGSIPGWGRASLCGVCMFAWISSGCSGFPQHQNIYTGVSPVSTLDQGAGSESGVISQALRCGSHCSSGTG